MRTVLLETRAMRLVTLQSLIDKYCAFCKLQHDICPLIPVMEYIFQLLIIIIVSKFF